MTLKNNYKNIITKTILKVALITLNRPESLNALSKDLITDLNDALNIIEHDENLSVIVITGSSKAFAAGSDIKEMIEKSFITESTDNFFEGDIHFGFNISRTF